MSLNFLLSLLCFYFNKYLISRSINAHFSLSLRSVRAAVDIAASLTPACSNVLLRKSWLPLSLYGKLIGQWFFDWNMTATGWTLCVGNSSKFRIFFESSMGCPDASKFITKSNRWPKDVLKFVRTACLPKIYSSTSLWFSSTVSGNLSKAISINIFGGRRSSCSG